MNGTSYEATVVNGEIRLPAGVELPENSKVFVIIPEEAQTSGGRLRSPRLADPDRAADFIMEVREIADAGI